MVVYEEQVVHNCYLVRVVVVYINYLRFECEKIRGENVHCTTAMPVVVTLHMNYLLNLYYYCYNNRLLEIVGAHKLFLLMSAHYFVEHMGLTNLESVASRGTRYEVALVEMERPEDL